MVESVTGEAIEIDALIFGGGIAGLWLLSRLRQQGYSAILVESGQLGSGQTIASQGIIHGGVKYALGGAAGRESEAISAMPEIWRSCLAGEGQVDLSQAAILSPRCYLWTTPGFGSRIMGLAASRAIRAKPDRLASADRPAVFEHAPTTVDVYGLDEPVLDVGSLIAALAEPHLDAIIHARFPEGIRVIRGENGVEQTHICVDRDDHGRTIEVRAHRYFFCAGAGNAAYLSRLGPAIAGFVRMQRRPLHMVMARGPLPELYGHAVGASATPLATITSGGQNGDRVWWIGGKLSEEGIEREPLAQIAAARAELARLVPWIDLADIRFATWRVDRAEGAQSAGKRPPGPIVRDVGNAIFCWPTKLALAPLACDEMLTHMPDAPAHAQPTLEAPRPSVADAPWQHDLEWQQ